MQKTYIVIKFKDNVVDLNRATLKKYYQRVLQISSRDVIEFKSIIPFDTIDGLNPLEISEKNVITDSLNRNNLNKTNTKKELGITINNLNSKMEKYGIIIVGDELVITKPCKKKSNKKTKKK